MAQPEYRRLKRIAVDGLFRTYDHEIELNLDHRVTLLHGPNGVGKTAVLRMTNALMTERLEDFPQIPFARFLLEFHDGSTLELASGEKTSKGETQYQLTLNTNGKSHSAKVPVVSQAAVVASRIEHLHPVDELPQAWVDLRDGEVLSATDVLSRYARGSPASRMRTSGKVTGLSKFLKGANSHLIGAERLTRMDWGQTSSQRYRMKSRYPSRISSVVECSDDFRKRLDTTMVEYGRESQLLDQSFPERLISATDQLTPPDLQTRMLALDGKTDELKKIGILNRTPTHPFSKTGLEGIDKTRLRVMTLYALDTEKKLSVFDDLARRAGTLLNNVNQKYRCKHIELNHKSGFVAVSENGQPLPLDSLSSGEQQELVLHYDLLFRVKSNTVVLIDEPELSLHVAWQKRFLPDLLETVKLSEFDALVATHSPFIVGERNDLMVGLGDLK